MQRMKPLFYACCLFIISLSSQALSAQKTMISPLTVGFDVGFIFTSKSNVNAQSVQIRSGYRFTRWLGICATVGYTNISSVDDLFLARNSLSRFGTPWTWVRKTHRVPVAIGPELNMRVGQGDLSIAAQFGLIYHQSKVYLNDPVTEYELVYNPSLNTYNSLSCSYTYWPQKRFGVSIGIQIQDWLSGDYSATALNAASLRQYPDLEQELVNEVRPFTTPFELELLQVGFTYRL